MIKEIYFIPIIAAMNINSIENFNFVMIFNIMNKY